MTEFFHPHTSGLALRVEGELVAYINTDVSSQRELDEFLAECFEDWGVTP